MTTLSEALEANKLTIEELQAVVQVLDRFDYGDRDSVLKTAHGKMRWHIAASRNEVDYDTGPTKI